YHSEKTASHSKHCSPDLNQNPEFEHITPVLASIHWLPINARANFKVLLLLTYKILPGPAPLYLRNLITPYVPPCPLRSQEADLLVIPRTRTKSLGNRDFSYCAPLPWNKLPAALKEVVSIEMPTQKSQLKTQLFSSYFE
ncbi:hypothetical protein LDENG_00202710, partial [Lucifuga dentata]